MPKYLLNLVVCWTLTFSVLCVCLDDILSQYFVLLNCDNQAYVSENCFNFQFINDSVLKLHLNIKGDNYRFFLLAYNHSIFATDIRITTEDGSSTRHFTQENLLNLLVYEGLDVNGTYACAYVSNNSFTGFLMLKNGSTIYIESFNKLNATSLTNKHKLVAYRGDIKSGYCSPSNNSKCPGNSFAGLGCKRENRRKIACFLKTVKEDRNPRYYFTNNYKSTKTTGNAQQFRWKNFSCSLSLTVDSSFYASNDYDVQKTLVQLQLMVKHADRVLRSTDFDGDGQQDETTLLLRSVTIRQNARFFNQTAVTDETLNRLVKDFRMVPQDECISLMLVSLRTESDLLTMAYGGGVCRNNEMEPEPARNIAVVNSMDDSGRLRPLFVTAWAVTLAIGQVMGSADRICNKTDLYPTDDWTAFFSKCRRNNIARILERQGSCLRYPNERGEEVQNEVQPEQTNILSLCGNGEVDTTEECDCGSTEQCKIKSSCCTPPGSKDECRYNRAKGYECDWTEDCCTKDCKLVPKTWNQFCGNGEPSCSPEEAYCNGNDPRCPIPRSAFSLKDGEKCGPATLKQVGAATCKAGRCNSTVCKDAGLEDCICSVASRQECRVCCKMREASEERFELCVPAEYFGLTSKDERFFYRHPGTACREVRFGHCNGYGRCGKYQHFGVSSAIIYLNHCASIMVLLLIILNFNYYLTK